MCKIKWIMPIKQAKESELPTTEVQGIRTDWCSTRHTQSVAATHEVQCTFKDGSVSDWIPCCSAHATYIHRFPNWRERPINRTGE